MLHHQFVGYILISRTKVKLQFQEQSKMLKGNSNYDSEFEGFDPESIVQLDVEEFA